MQQQIPNNRNDRNRNRIDNSIYMTICMSILIGLCMGFMASEGYSYAMEEKSENEAEKSDYMRLKDMLENDGFKGVEVILYNSSQNLTVHDLTYHADYLAKINGLYFPCSDVIYMEDKMPERAGEMIRTLFHEYGHHIWYQVMNESERDVYMGIYNSTDGFASTYALEGGPEEDFAESYEAYMMSDPLPASKYNFMRDVRRKA